MRITLFKFFAALLLLVVLNFSGFAQNYVIAGTNQTTFYDNSVEIAAPSSGEAFYGQNAHYPGNIPSYSDNGDGTVTDNVTGLMWQMSADLNQDGEINVSDKYSFHDALNYADTLTLGGFDDWRLPTVKELYSLILFSGIDISGPNPTIFVPFIDDETFGFGYGDESAGERLIDAQYASSTLYVSTTMGGAETMFGVNFADGRIKGYPLTMPGRADKLFYVKCVRAGQGYGENDFIDNGDGTITDQATGLMWQQDDSGEAKSWEESLEYAENSTFAGYNDWRLPDAKELQSIVDYTRSPATTSSAAIDPIFNCSQITDEGGNINYPFYWASTTHVNESETPGHQAVYVCFGEALGWLEEPPMSGNYTLTDVHGAGAQRCDFKTGDPASYPYGFGPQGDVVRINHYVRLVRGNSVAGMKDREKRSGINIFPNPSEGSFRVEVPEETEQLVIIDLSGRTVLNRELVNEGVCEFELVDSGVYVIRMVSGNLCLTGKIVVL